MSEKKLTKRKIQANRTRKKIFDVAIELMEKNGFNNMTIEDICEKAGVSVGTFYHYYQSKEDVFYELYRKADEYFIEVVTPALDNLTADTWEKIIIFFKYYAEYQTKQKFENTSQVYNAKNKLFIDEDRYMITYLFELVAKGQENNELNSDMSSRDTAVYLFIVSRGIVFDWCVHDAGYDLVERMDRMFRKLTPVFKF